jgi:hypothetical protein
VSLATCCSSGLAKGEVLRGGSHSGAALGCAMGTGVENGACCGPYTSTYNLWISGWPRGAYTA